MPADILIEAKHIADDWMSVWNELIGQTISSVDTAEYEGLGELAEIAILTTGLRFYVATTLENGANDASAFYRLSIRSESHFSATVISSADGNCSEVDWVGGSRVLSIRFYRNSTQNTGIAISIVTSKGVFGIATSKWIPNAQKYSRCGLDHLSLLRESEFLSLVDRQRLSVSAQTNRHWA